MKTENTNNLEITNTERLGKPLNFLILKPGGNDTALVQQLVPDMQRRRKINDTIMSIYPNVEQVGFMSKGENDTGVLQMAGGEFCGNATRSTAFTLLNGKPGEITMNVSGVNSWLRAGVSKDGQAFAQMPVFKDRVTVENITKGNQEEWIAILEGIGFDIQFKKESETRSPEELKTYTRDIITQKGLDSLPAAGLIIASPGKNGGYEITPIVWVKGIDTLFVETACGSGTTALGLVEATKTGSSINNVSVMQPSGKPINISVTYDGKDFGYSQISGPIDQLTEGTIQVEGKNPYSIEQVNTKDQLEKINRDGLPQLYAKVFGTEPYNELFTDEQVKEIFQTYLDNRGIILVTRDAKGIAGFGVAVPLATEPELAKIVAEGGIVAENSWYMADLGVRDESRKNGIGTALIGSRLQRLPSGSAAVMRTSVNNEKSQSLYRNVFGFQEVVGVRQNVTNTRVDGSISSDERLFLSKTI